MQIFEYLKIISWKWWRSIDKQLTIAILMLFSISLILITTTSPAIAGRIGVPENFFIIRHIFYVMLGVSLMVIFSSLEISNIKKFAISFFVINILLLILVKAYGYEAKGARRWINILGFSMQPSEFIKPCFAIFTAYCFTTIDNRNLAFLFSLVAYLVVAILLVLQPDIGMLLTLTGIWGAQIFIAGMPFIWIVCAFIIVIVGMFLAYHYLPHVTQRIDSFLDPTGHENYQVEQSLNAFKNGGYLGLGPGEGVIKHKIPDAHADFIFAVAGEEFGSIFCSMVSLLFAFIVIRGMFSLLKRENEFIVLGVSGILSQFAIQSIINMGVALRLLPTKGMTLPLISYGGSSTISIGIALGMVLSLLKERKINTKYNVLEK